MHLGLFVNRISAMNLLSLLGVLKDPKVLGEPGLEGLRFFSRPTTEQLEVEISSIETDSRQLSPDSAKDSVQQSQSASNAESEPFKNSLPVFVAVRGSQQDGHQYLPQIMGSDISVAAIVADESTIRQMQAEGRLNAKLLSRIPILLVADTRFALDLLARRQYFDPSHRLLCFGVTGTNGKTSTVYLLEHLLNKAGLKAGVMGTIDHHLDEQIWPSSHTTPAPVQLQARLAQMKELGAQAVAMEVSSHALDQHRADGVQFNVAIFTNLTRDHLDYHQTEKAYFAAKQRLFTDLLGDSQKIPLMAIVNIDDSWGRRLRVTARAALWTIGKSKTADFNFRVLSQDFSGQKFKLQTPLGDFEAELPLIGEHNLYNAVGAIAAVTTVGVPLEKSLKSLPDFAGIPGRLQRVPDPRGRSVFVDYAHTPDALENVLKTISQIRQQQSGQQPRILTLFGCGGDRDTGKRPQMARIAAQFSDRVWVTSDNPRSENPQAIIDDILRGFQANDLTKVKQQVDRALAIEEILQEAQSGDVVLIAGKGHETYQEILGEKRDFSDVLVAEKFLRR